MKQPLIIFFLLILISSCQKNTSDLGPEFHYFVGHWKNINGDDEINIYVNENGKVDMHCSVERGQKFRVRKLRSVKDLDFYGFPRKEYVYSDKDGSGPYLQIDVNLNYDTARFYINGKKPTVNDTLLNDEWIFFIKD
jgi:hypothetical protein